MPILNAVIGLVLLVFGRRLFWFFVAAAGFACGLYVAHEYLKLSSDALVLAIAALAGLAGALLAMLVQKLAVGVAGFAAGALAGVTLVRAFGSEHYALIGLSIGGLVGALVLIAAFEWALIILSSLLGASMLASREVAGESAPLVFIVALVVGIIIQSFQRERAGSKRRGEQRDPPRRR